jgi:hypothetical protein
MRPPINAQVSRDDAVVALPQDSVITGTRPITVPTRQPGTAEASTF